MPSAVTHRDESYAVCLVHGLTHRRKEWPRAAHSQFQNAAQIVDVHRSVASATQQFERVGKIKVRRRIGFGFIRSFALLPDRVQALDGLIWEWH